MTKRFLIDGYNLIYRLFYAVPPFSLPDGTPIHVVFGLAKSILGFFERHPDSELFFIMDSKAENHRSKIYPDYKANRDRMPDDLRVQEPYIFSLLEAFGIPVVVRDGYESDDIIATLCKRFSDSGDGLTYVVSGDKDLYQLIDDRTFVYDTMRNKIAKHSDAVEKFGVGPEFVLDWLAICGDTSDNIPGIPGFGPKKAVDLIGRFGTLENIYENLSSLPAKMASALEEHKDVAFLSKSLASLHYEVPLTPADYVGFPLSGTPFTPDILAFFVKMGFRSLLPKGETAHSLGISPSEAPSIPVPSFQIYENAVALNRVTPLFGDAPALGFSLRTDFKNGDSKRSLYVSIDDSMFVFNETVDPYSFSRCLDLLDAFPGNIHGFDTKESLRSTMLNDKSGLGGIPSQPASSQLCLL